MTVPKNADDVRKMALMGRVRTNLSWTPALRLALMERPELNLSALTEAFLWRLLRKESEASEIESLRQEVARLRGCLQDIRKRMDDV